MSHKLIRKILASILDPVRLVFKFVYPLFTKESSKSTDLRSGMIIKVTVWIDDDPLDLFGKQKKM